MAPLNSVGVYNEQSFKFNAEEEQDPQPTTVHVQKAERTDYRNKAPSRNVSVSGAAKVKPAGPSDTSKQQKKPGKTFGLVAAADAYATGEPKSPTPIGGIITILALAAALAYTAYQLYIWMHTPPVVTSYVEWSDTQGPFPAKIRCTAPNGCYVSNRHNDNSSSHGDQVEAAQQGCLKMAQGDEHIINITFTQNPLNGLVMVWDPSTWEQGTTPGSGVQIMAETNQPAALDGIYILGTPVVGGVYLANYVQTHNYSARQPAAQLRREWFITYVAGDTAVNPAASACASQLTPAQQASFIQATIRITSAWYRVTVTTPDVLMMLIGSCGGALQLCLQAGGIALITYEIFRHKAPPVVRSLTARRRRPSEAAKNARQSINSIDSFVNNADGSGSDHNTTGYNSQHAGNWSQHSARQSAGLAQQRVS